MRHDEYGLARVRVAQVGEDGEHPPGPFTERLAAWEPVFRGLLEAHDRLGVLGPDLIQGLPLPLSEVELPQPSVGLGLQAEGFGRGSRREDSPLQWRREDEVDPFLLRPTGERAGLLATRLVDAYIRPAHVAVVAVPLCLSVAGEQQAHGIRHGPILARPARSSSM